MKQKECFKFLRLMLLSRAADNREAMLIRQGKAHMHVPSAGHEALMVLPWQLKKADYLYPYYRGCHLMMGKGLDRKIIARDFFAKKQSTSGGRNMSAHCGSIDLHIFPSAAPTASQCIPAVGTAWGQKILNTSDITVCSIGDGAIREGEFYEAVCFAIQYQLPIIFLIEDNQYGISTKTDTLSPFRLNIFDEEIYVKLDGSDVFSVFEASKNAIEKARNKKGPTILWCEVDRLKSHTAGDDHRLYRSQEELVGLQDPIEKFVNQLIMKGFFTHDEYLYLEKQTNSEITEIYKIIENEPEPDLLDNIQSHLYGPLIRHQSLNCSPYHSDITIVEALNNILSYSLQSDPKVLLFGQDIEDPKGGVFGFTKGLSSQYPGRVINAPISEATIIGAAVGLSVLGFKPIFEIQFIDFITPGFDQLVSQVSSLRWRSCGQWKCPLILYAPYGAYLPGGGLWHSQSNEGWWAHIPGLRVAIPSTPGDVAGLFWAAQQDEDPSLILIPKHLSRLLMTTDTFETIPFGRAKIRKRGSDVTAISWGNCVELAEKAATIAEKEGISVEVIDLRTLVPCDWETIDKSLEKTGRLVVVHEDNRTCGFGSTLITEVVSRKETFAYLYSSPQLVARDDIHIPFHPKLEYAILPDINKVLSAIYSTCVR